MSLLGPEFRPAQKHRRWQAEKAQSIGITNNVFNPFQFKWSLHTNDHSAPQRAANFPETSVRKHDLFSNPEMSARSPASPLTFFSLRQRSQNRTCDAAIPSQGVVPHRVMYLFRIMHEVNTAERFWFFMLATGRDQP